MLQLLEPYISVCTVQQNALASVSFQSGVCVSPTTTEYLHSYFLLCWQHVCSKIILELEEDFLLDLILW